jgi:hypothetical protein
MGPTGTHEPIIDWSREGRTRLVQEQGDRMRALLEVAFETFLDDKGVGLAAFRFRSDGPVAEAVEWCVERFQSADIDPGKLRAGSNSWRLFTEVSFWLSQRETAAGYRRALAHRKGEYSDVEEAPSTDESPETVATRDIDARRVRDRISDGVIALRETCCAALVGWWLIGSARQRRVWFENDDLADEWNTALAADQGRTSKERSFHIADALFRYLALFAGLVRRDGDESHRACVQTWFDRCVNEPPYEAPRAAVRAALGGLPSRQMTSLRHDGVITLIRRCVALTDRSWREVDPLVNALSLSSLRLSLLHRFRIKDDDLEARIRSLKGASE